MLFSLKATLHSSQKDIYIFVNVARLTHGKRLEKSKRCEARVGTFPGP